MVQRIVDGHSTAHRTPCQRSIPAQAGEPDRGSPRPRMSRVYPRAGGGTVAVPETPIPSKGLSPRRRGNRSRAVRAAARARSIPAQAGEPTKGLPFPFNPRVYPRAGGGTAFLFHASGLRQGLSPRRRGNRDAARRLQVGLGSIPAQAGEPRAWRMRAGASRVYPRAGGERGFGFQGSISLSAEAT